MTSTGNNNNSAYFLRSDRIGFSIWQDNMDHVNYALGLWCNEEVSKYLSTQTFTNQQVKGRLIQEIKNYEQYKIQYFPLFLLDTNEFIGVCGIRNASYEDNKETVHEMGFHIVYNQWRK